MLAAWLLGGGPAAAQPRPGAADSIRPAYPSPMLRPLVIHSGMLPARHVTTRYGGVPLREANALPGHQMRIVGVVPLLMTKPIILLAGFNYLREQGSYDRPVHTTTTTGRDTTLAYTRQDVSMSVTAVRQDSLFRRPVVYMASVTGTSRHIGGIEKVTGGVTALLTLRSTPQTRLAAGFTLQLNPSVATPLMPVLTYWHRLGRSPWELDALLPLRAHLRRPLLADKCWLSLGTDLMSTHSFGSGTVPGFSNTFEANTTSVQTGAMFEFLASRYFMVGIRGGLDSPLSQWVGEKNSSYAAIRAEAAPAGYLGLVLSVTVPAKKH